MAEHHGQTQRSEVPSDGSHRLAEIILRDVASRADLHGAIFRHAFRIPVIYGSVRAGRQASKSPGSSSDSSAGDTR